MENEIFNPKNLPIKDLPFIYGFNNGGAPSMLDAVLLGEDGTYLGGHICSSEGFMRGDLGIIKGSRPDRHKGFIKHYPDGYQMEFVENPKSHPGLMLAYERNQKSKKLKNPEEI